MSYYRKNQSTTSIKDAARIIGVHPQTLYKALRYPSSLKKLLNKLEAQVLDPSTQHLDIVETFTAIIEARRNHK